MSKTFDFTTKRTFILVQNKKRTTVVCDVKELYQLYQKKIKNFACKSLYKFKGSLEVDDLVQELAIQFIKCFSTYNEKDPFDYYLYKSMWNRLEKKSFEVKSNIFYHDATLCYEDLIHSLDERHLHHPSFNMEHICNTRLEILKISQSVYRRNRSLFWSQNVYQITQLFLEGFTSKDLLELKDEFDGIIKTPFIRHIPTGKIFALFDKDKQLFVLEEESITLQNGITFDLFDVEVYKFYEELDQTLLQNDRFKKIVKSVNANLKTERKRYAS